MKKQEQELDKESIKRGEALQKLFQMKEWEVIGQVYEAFEKLWKKQLLRYDASDSIEKIAMERIQYVSKLSGLEIFFSQIQQDRQAFLDAQKEDDDEEEIKQPKKETKKPFKSINPYREQE